ncbi:MAG: phosphoribosylglycinamide formyltransferase [Acidobacteria bacterium]|nr:MAG: phosphoribosylglycinamide formyltransferase [Acidobacteriota bacterium]
MTRFAVLASGAGTNLQAILDAVASGQIAAEPSLVLTDRPNAKALDRAQAAGIPRAVLPFKDFESRETFTDAVVAEVKSSGADFVVLAGFMRILAPAACEAYPNAIINTHPSLLPAFQGASAVAEAIAYGVTVTGCTVHLIDEELDHGPIIVQEAVPVLPGDDEESLHERIKVVEHRLLPEVVANFAQGRYRVDGRHVALT